MKKRLKVSWDIYRNSTFLKGLSLFFLLLLAADLIFPPDGRMDYSTVVLDRDGKILSAYLNRDEIWRIKVRKNEVSPAFLKAIVQKEDKYFYYHPGVNLISLVKAAVKNIRAGKRISGASTITMQVVRMLHPQNRTYLAKVSEMLRAVQLEWHHSKDEILEMYLNLIPFGSNIEGIKTASLLYLQKHPSRLSPAEATLLSIIPNHPKLVKPSADHEQLKNYYTRWLDFYARKGIFPEKEIQIARNEQVVLRRRPLPRLAPHLCNRLQAENPLPYIRSTIRLSIQQSVQSSLTSHLQKLKPLGLQNGMAMVVDNQTMEVIAYCGSAGFEEKADGGQVDGIQAVRSPGSTLKPFLYGLALQGGLLSARTILYDIPSDFDGYTPKNFTDTYQGQITARDALQLSLNIPAVSLLQQYGLKNYIEALKKAGFSSIRSKEDELGLSLILGGCGVKMEELTRLYAALASYGNLRDLVFHRGQTQGNTTMLMDSSAAYIVSNILSGIQRPDFPNHFEFTYKLPRIAWKTGTSYGKKDAWAIGYNSRYTIAVWLGNFKGNGVPRLSGAEVATPLLFSIFNQTDHKSAWYKMPESLVFREVCPVSGLPRNSFCEKGHYDEFPGNAHYKKKCNHVQTVWTNREKTFSYCNTCLKKSDAIAGQFTFYPPRYLEFLQRNGLPYDRIPPHNPGCHSQITGQPLQISSPRQGGQYFVNDKEEIELRAYSTGKEENLIWYHNNRLLGTYPVSESLFIKPDIGKNTVSCTDMSGRTVSVTFDVKAF